MIEACVVIRIITQLLIYSDSTMQSPEYLLICSCMTLFIPLQLERQMQVKPAINNPTPAPK